MSLILIVDDQLISRMILEKLAGLLAGASSIHAFADPVEALDWAGAHTPDLVLADYKMPRLDGIEFTQRFRLLPSGLDVPLIVVTSVEDRDVRYRALEAGATDFLTKPVDHHEFRARARNLLLMRRQQNIIKGRALWLEERVAEATREILVREQETLLRLAKAGEHRDELTGNHVLRMASYSRTIAQELALPTEECENIELSAPMHDIGKIGVSDAILLKEGRLTPSEFSVLKKHTEIGYEILKGSPSKFLQMGALIALRHHEKFDGTGYPNGLRGEGIPLVARIVAVADVYDALTTRRPYKRAWTPEEALEYLCTERGRHFDPTCVDAFCARLDRAARIRFELADAPKKGAGEP